MNRGIIKRLLFAISLIFIFSVSVYAVPALEKTSEVSQPNGKKIYIIKHGDEFFNWNSDSKGNVLVKDNKKYWCYGKISNGKLIASKYKYAIDKEPSTGTTIQKDLIKLYEDQKLKNDNSLNDFQRTQANKSLSTQPHLNGQTQKILVLLVSFTNQKIKYSDDEWNKLFFGDVNSVSAYYKEVSNGTFSFKPAKENRGIIDDGIINVTLPYEHPNTGKDIGTKNQKIVAQALTVANPYIDYSQFDTNHDGIISTDELHIVTVIAGYEASCSYQEPSIWAHRWDLGSMAPVLDGVRLSNYTQQGEIHGNHMATIGVPCHELGHDLGLPDLYDYDSSSKGLGIHSLMAEGSWGYVNGGDQGSSPTHLDAWSKCYLGFATPKIVTNNGLFTVNSSTNYNVLRINTDDPKEYFLVDNREFEGFDSGLKRHCVSGGIQILHVDEGVMETKNMYGVNNDETHKGVDVEEANEGKLGKSQLDTNDGSEYDHYYYVGNGNTLFSNDTKPNSKLYDGSNTNLSIETLSAAGESMKVSVKKTSQNIQNAKVDINIDNANIKPVPNTLVDFAFQAKGVDGYSGEFTFIMECLDSNGNKITGDNISVAYNNNSVLSNGMGKFYIGGKEGINVGDLTSINLKLLFKRSDTYEIVIHAVEDK